MPPETTFAVPWIWIRSLATAWEKYKTDGGPVGHAFGLEGGGQGKSPTIAGLMQRLDGHWVVPGFTKTVGLVTRERYSN